jgi:hypothetical protein
MHKNKTSKKKTTHEYFSDIRKIKKKLKLRGYLKKNIKRPTQPVTLTTLINCFP